MIEVEERFMIKDLYRRGVTISEIARQTGHDRKTIRTIVNTPLQAVTKTRQTKGRKIDSYVAYLEKRISEGVFNAQKLYQEIVAQGYTGKDRQVRQFVQPFREARQRQATVRYETEPGQQAQVDWGSFGFIDHEGRRRRLYGFVMTLGWSRAMYLEFTVSADTAWWLRCHLHAFHYFDGVPQQVLHDNLKTAVLFRATDGVIHWHPRYLDFAHYYGFTPRACQPYRAQTKGKVESGVRYVKGNFWPGLTFHDLNDLNHQGQQWLETIANVRRHGTTRQIPALQLPKEGLQSLSGKPDYDTRVVAYRRSSKDCLVSYEGNYYSVPATYAQQQLMLKETESKQLLILTLDGQELTRHPLAEGHSQRVIQRIHYQGLIPYSTKPKRLVSGQVNGATGSGVLDAPVVEHRPLDQYEFWVEVSA